MPTLGSHRAPYRALPDSAKLHPGYACYRNRVASCDINLGESWKVRLHDHLMESLADCLGGGNVTVIYQ